MRRFNTEGPVRPDEHYAIPPLGRVDMEELRDLCPRKRGNDGLKRHSGEAMKQVVPCPGRAAS